MSRPYVTGQHRGSRLSIGEADGNDFSLGDYVHMRLEVTFGLSLYTHRGSGCDGFWCKRIWGVATTPDGRWICAFQPRRPAKPD